MFTAALDAAGHRDYVALVCLRLGDPVAFAPPIEGNCFTAMAGFRRKEYRNERAIRPTD